MRKYIWIIGLFFLNILQAQQDPQFSHYYRVIAAYNPAYSGVNGNVSINLLSRNQWVKLEGAPVTQLLQVDAPVNIFNSQAGVGMKIMNDKYGFVNDMFFGFTFSKFFVLPYGTLSAGLATSIFSKEISGEWSFPDQTEALFGTQARSVVLDFDAGVFYTYQNIFAGFSVTHVNAPKFVFISDNGTNQQVGIVRHYYLVGGYKISTTGNFDVTPSFLVKSDGHIIQTDINLNILYNKKIWAGVSYRNGESIVGFIGTSYIKDIKIGLSYDALLNSIGRASSGSFEVYVGYNFSLLKMEKPQHYHNVKTL